MFYSTAILALATLASAQKVLFEGSGYRATVYYGVNDGDVCGTPNGGPFPANWAVSSGINDGYPFCTSKIQTEAKTLTQYNSNRIVAMNANMMANDREYWCGKEVQIFKDGKQIILDEGPFVLYDGCAACTSASIIDLSAKAFTLVSGGSCGNNPEGISIKVIDNDLSGSLNDASRGGASGSSPYNPAGGDSKEPAAESSAAPQQPSPSPAAETPAKETPAAETPAETPATPSVTSSSSTEKAHEQPTPINAGNLAAETPAAVQPSPSPAVDLAAKPAVDSPAAEAAAPVVAAAEPSTDECKFGKWQCNGLQLQICNRKTQASTSWETIASCASECTFTVTGSAICQ